MKEPPPLPPRLHADVRRSETGDDLERGVRGSEDREADRPGPIQEPFTSSPARRLTALGVAVALFAASGVLAWRALRPEPPSKEPSKGEPAKVRVPDSSAPVEPTRFAPEVTVEGDIARVDVTFPDGSEATLAYPDRLGLISRGVQPDVSYVWIDDPPPRFPIVFLHGPRGIETSFIRGTKPEAVYTLPDGSEVELWPAVETDYTTLREIDRWLSYRTPSWSVLVSLGYQSNAAVRSTAAEQLSAALSIVESRTGLPVITATGPIELAEGFGESEGAVLAIGDGSPRPDTATLDGTIFLSPDGCSGGPEHEGRGYGSNCLAGGNVFASIYGDERFVDAVLDGLQVEAFTPAR